MRLFSLVFLFASLSAYAQLTDLEESRIDSIKQTLEFAKHDSIKINGWHLWAEIVLRSDSDLYLKLLEKADNLCDQKISSGIGEEKEFYQKAKVTGLNRKGDYLRRKAQFDKAKDIYEEALEINIQRKNKKAIAGSYNNIGIIHGIKAEYDQCKEYMLKSLDIYEELKDQSGIANSYNNLGNIHYYQGDYKPAIDYWTKSLLAKEKEGEKLGMANTLNNIGNIYKEQEDYEKSIDYYMRSLKLYEEIDDPQGVVVSSYNIGNNYMEMEDNESAQKFLERSLKISEETGNKRGIAGALNGLGSIHFNKKQMAKAEANFVKSMELHEEIGDNKGLSVSQINLAQVYLETGRVKESLKLTEKSLVLAKEMNSLKRKGESYKNLWKIYKRLGNPSKALKMYEIFIETRDSLENQEVKMAIMKKEYEYQYEKQAIADSIQAAEESKLLDAKLEAEQAKTAQRSLETDKERQQKYFLFGGLAVALIFLGLVFNRFRLTSKQKEIIEKQKDQVYKAFDELEVKNKEILDSIKYAKRIQNAILPPAKSVSRLIPNSFIVYKPKDIVAGDFYWLEEKDGKILIAACDCTGHGVPGAMVSVVCVNGLNRAVREHGLTIPGKILDKTREIVISEFEKSDENVNDGMDVALVALAQNEKQNENDDSHSPDSFSVCYSGAHNPLWILRQGSGEIEEIKADKQPIGKFGNPIPYKTHELELSKGDTIYLFSDGYVDQFGGEKGKKYKTSQLKQKLISIQNDSMTRQGEILNKEFEKWKGDLEQLDDVVILGVRV